MTLDFDPRKPAWVERAAAWLDGRPTTRLIFIFRAVGCAYARQPGGGCTMCGFQKMTTRGVPIAPADLLAQFESLFEDPKALEGVSEVDLYNSGSFLADVEVPEEVRARVLGRLGRTAVRRVLIEARPEYVRAENLAAARAALGDKELEVGIGLESSDDHVRDVLVRKGFGRADFERAVGLLAGAKARLLAYLVVKPPGLGEALAVEDAVASARYVFEVAKRFGVPARAALQPVFVATGTDLEREYLAGRYRPPSLWSVVEVVRRAHPYGELLVGLSDEGLEPHLLPSGCEKCTGALRAALAQYNRSRDLAAFEGLDCDCRRDVTS
ncbi:MAG: hypothetical protein ACYC8T_02900 [Myxococcaceae bacterium]